jgi:hypothetical protein
VAAKQTVLSSFFMDWDNQPVGGVSTPNQADWEKGVNATLHELSVRAPNGVSQAVIAEIQKTNKVVTISPFAQTFIDPSNGKRVGANATSNGLDPAAATRPGGIAVDAPGLKGVGGGSNVIVRFTPQDWDVSPDSLGVRDETLLHEFVHVMRETQGVEDQVPCRSTIPLLQRGDDSVARAASDIPKYQQSYQEFEEFIAVLITNIYRSENGRPGLVRDHKSFADLLPSPLCYPREFLTVWRTQIKQLCSEEKQLCDNIATIDCKFNPIFELYNQRDAFRLGGRVLK